MNLLDNLWSQFGKFYTDNDQNKLFERYTNSFKGEYLSVYDKIKNLVTYYISYAACPVELLKHHEVNAGYPDSLSQDTASRRKLLAFKPLIDSLKGCERSFEVAYRACRFKIDDFIVDAGYELVASYPYYVDGEPDGSVVLDVGPTNITVATGTYFKSPDTVSLVSVDNAWIKRQTIEELPDGSASFDDPDRTFDSAIRTFDSGAKTCGNFNVHLYGSLTITPTIIRSMYLIAKYCKPIDADILYIYYNGVLVLDWVVEIYINGDGDLVFNNDPDPNLMLSIIDGDLYVSGERASFYAKSINGDLIYDDGI